MTDSALLEKPDSPALRVLRAMTEARLARLSLNCSRKAVESKETGDRPHATYYSSVAHLSDLVRMERAVERHQAVAEVGDFLRSLGLSLEL